MSATGEREGEGKMREQYVSMITPLKVTEMPGHPARRENQTAAPESALQHRANTHGAAAEAPTATWLPVSNCSSVQQ